MAAKVRLTYPTSGAYAQSIGKLAGTTQEMDFTPEMTQGWSDPVTGENNPAAFKRRMEAQGYKVDYVGDIDTEWRNALGGSAAAQLRSGQAPAGMIAAGTNLGASQMYQNSGLQAPKGQALNPGSAAQANAGQPAFNGSLKVLMPDGITIKEFTGEVWKDRDLDAAIQAGAKPLGANGQPVKVDKDVYGGYLFDGKPINQFVGAPAQAGQNEALAAYNSGGPAIVVRMKDGSFQSFTGEPWKDQALDAALKDGAIPLNPLTGKDMKVVPDVNGGWGFQGEGDPYALPINVVSGADWQDGQQQALQQYYSSPAGAGAGGGGGTPTGPNGARYPVAGLNNSTGNPELDNQLNSPLMNAFPYDFSYTASDFYKDPSFDFLMSEGLDEIEKQGSAKGKQLSGAQRKDLERFRTGLASQEFQAGYGRASSEFDRNYQIFENTQAKRFNRLSSVAGMGQTAIPTLNNAGSNYAGGASSVLLNNGQNQGNIAIDSGNARASGYVAGANGVNNAVAGGVNNFNNWLTASQMFRR